MTEVKGLLDFVTHQYLRELCEEQMDPITEAICKQPAKDSDRLIVNTLMYLHLHDSGRLSVSGAEIYFLGCRLITDKYANALWRIE